MVGAGVMGLPLARRLTDAGYGPLVWVRDPTKRQRLEAEGFAATTDRSGLRGSDVVVSCLLDEQAVREVYFGPDGLASLLEPGSLIIEHATLAPEFAIETAASLARLGIRFADAPVSGGPAGAEQGTLSAMVGCAEEDFDEIEALLRHTCASVVHAGSVGAGETLKLVNQFLVAAHSVAAAEAAALLRHANIAADVALQALTGGWASSRRLELQLVDSMTDAFTPDGAGLTKFEKDLHHVHELVSRSGVRSALLPSIEASWFAASAAHPDAAFAALVTSSLPAAAAESDTNETN
ncbi:NAD(P)-dependent oxidoreductase [Gulosibacter faecalis]|nr:NAD(P)-dependent oxidoreductase [Gulosibacter faecalis]